MLRLPSLVTLVALAACTMPLTEAGVRETPGFVAIGDWQLAAVNTRANPAQPAVFPISQVSHAAMARSAAWEQFDVWFSEDGADLIAANLAPPPPVALFPIDGR